MILYIWLTYAPNEDIRYIFKIKNFCLIKEVRKVNFFSEVKLVNKFTDLV